MSQWIYTPDPQYRGARVDDSARSRKVKLQVQTTDPDATEEAIRADSGFSWGDPDPLDAYKTLRSIEINRDSENPYYWEMLLEYRSDVSYGGNPFEPQLPPLMRPPEFEWNYEEVEEPIDVDANDMPICTTAGESFDPPVTKPFADLVATVTFYRASWDAAMMRTLVNTVNSDEWYGWPPGTVKFTAPRARSVIEPPWPMCFLVTYTFKCRPDGWKQKVLNAGLMEWDGTYDGNNKKIRQILSDDRKPIETPWPLDANGQKIPIGANGQYTKPLMFLEIQKFPAIPFAGFGV